MLLPDPDELWHGRLAGMLAASFLYRDDDRQRFLNLKPDGAGSLIDRFSSLMGWAPPAGAAEWEELRVAASVLPVSRPWTDFTPADSGIKSCASLPSSFYETDSDASRFLDRLLQTESGVEFLCTGLYSPGAAPFDEEGCRISLLPHRNQALEVLVVNPVSTDVEERYPSLLHFFMRRWNLYEISEWFREFKDKPVDFALDPDHLEGRLKAFEYLAREELMDRPWYLDPAVLRRRSYWLYGHTSLNPIPGFTRELRLAPSMMDWELELPMMSRMPVLACYWMLAHLFLGNAQAARLTAERALQMSGELVQALAAKILLILENPERAGISAAALRDIQETTMMCARPHHLEKGAQQSRELLLASLASKDSDANTVLCPDFLWKI